MLRGDIMDGYAGQGNWLGNDRGDSVYDDRDLLVF